MAEIESQAKLAQAQAPLNYIDGKLVPVPVPVPAPAFRLIAREFTPSGESMEITADLPTELDFEKWSVMQQVVMLKKGTWKNASVADILFGLAYARKLGLDVMSGDVYSLGDGRIATSNKAKIKMAFATKRIKGFTTEIKELKENAINLPGCPQKYDLECTVTLDVEGLNKPVVRKAKLSAWFNGKNPNWTGRPDHMLELNTMAHACEYVHPTETGLDELPDQEVAQIGAGKVAASTLSYPERASNLRAIAEAEKAKAQLANSVPLSASVSAGATVEERPLAEVVG